MENEWNRKEWKRKKLEDLGERIAMSEIEELHSFDDYIMDNWNYIETEKRSDY